MAKRKKSKYDKYFSPRTHSSITAFSKNAGGASKRRKSYTEKRRNKIAAIICASILGAAVVFVSAFFITDTLIGVSNATVEETKAPSKKPAKQESQKPQQTKPEAVKNKIDLKAIKAKQVDSNLLSNPANLDSTIKSLKSSGINAVIIDFKDEDGFIHYKSSIEKLKDSEILSKAQENAPTAIKKLQSAGINVIARVYCFKDPQMPRVDRLTAALYGDTKSLWLDNDPKKGGKPWLNPYSKEATDYLNAVVKEVAALGVDAVMLDGVQFPNLYSPITTFKGESGSRNTVLVNFVNSCVKTAGNTPVIVAMNAEAALTGKSKIYGDGSLFDSNASLFAMDTTTLKPDAKKKYPEGKSIIEIKKTAADADKSYIISK